MTTLILHAVDKLILGGSVRVMQNLTKLYDRTVFDPVISGVFGDESFVKYLRSEGIQAGIINEDLSGLPALTGGRRPFVAFVGRSGEETPVWNRVLPALAREGADVVVERSIFGNRDTGPASVVADRILFNSMHTLWKHWQESGRPPIDEYLTRHRVLRNAVVLDPTAEELREGRSKVRDDLDIPVDAFVVGHICRPDPRRLDYMMIGVLPRLLKRIDQFYFIARSFPESMTRPLAKVLGDRFRNIPPTNSTSEMMETYAAMDTLVHFSSMGESAPNAIAEAMRCGLPVVTNETPGRRQGNAQVELVLHGKTGFLANDPCSVLQRLVELADSPELRDKFGEAGKALFRRPPYSPPSVIRQVESEIVVCARAKGWAIPDASQPEARLPSDDELYEYLTKYASRATVPPLAKSWRDVPWNLAVNGQRLAWRVRRKLL